MLTEEQVKEYTDEYYNINEEKVDRLRLCYLKDGKLCRLGMRGEGLEYTKFHEFINQQEDLTEDMLGRPSGKRYELGTYRILENGEIIDLDSNAQVKRIVDTILEAAKVFN